MVSTKTTTIPISYSVTVTGATGVVVSVVLKSVRGSRFRDWVSVMVTPDGDDPGFVFTSCPKGLRTYVNDGDSRWDDRSHRPDVTTTEGMSS